MARGDYLNLFIDAGTSDQRDQEKYSRYIDAVIAEEGLGVADIIGVGEKGTSSNLPLYVVHRQAICFVSQVGMFKNKRIEVKRMCPIASIARLRGTQEGFKGADLTITANDAAGNVVFKAVWGLGGPDWVEPLIQRQRENLFKVIGEAMDRIAEAPARPSVSTASSKSGALMDWAADVVKASGVEVTAERVEQHANMAAGGIRFMVFLRLGASLGIDDLNKFYPSGKEPDGTPLQTFDRLYEGVVAHVGGAGVVDAAMDKLLAESWGEFVRGCRETYS